MLAQQAIPASKNARDARPMAADADIPFADKRPIALPFALCPRTTTAATMTTGAVERPALDDLRLADVECQPDNTATAIITELLSLLSSSARQASWSRRTLHAAVVLPGSDA